MRKLQRHERILKEKTIQSDQESRCDRYEHKNCMSYLTITMLDVMNSLIAEISAPLILCQALFVR